MNDTNAIVEHATYGPFRGGIYHLAFVRWWSGKVPPKVEVNIWPAGRSVTVYVDGVRWLPSPEGAENDAAFDSMVEDRRDAESRLP